MGSKGKKARAFKFNAAQTIATKTSSSSYLEPPVPYRKASPNIEPFLAKLNKSHIYITHIDPKPRDFKRKIFLVPLFMNFAIIGMLFYRIQTKGPWYMKICYSLIGQKNEMTIDMARISFLDIVRELILRAIYLIVDVLVYVFIWPWPRDFFAGSESGNPVVWRLGVGFRDKEIIVRKSRKWDCNVGNVIEAGDEQNAFFDIISRAVDPVWMSEKTGYLMLSKEWDLDWGSMVMATQLVDKGTMSLEEFKTTILVYDDDFGWMFVEIGNAGGRAQEEDGRRKIIAFKEELTALGKESLFFRWIELVQFESSQPGGFGPERQRETMLKAKELFESQGIEFDMFWAKVGGMNGMASLDQM